ncbi:hypothetical protein JA33_069 [Dickeya phage vB_DsoM_JA33]|uniref:Uncharacterized protein n=3 Tax=Salmondvirus JA11 TaxID=2734141 RepID=A0A384ZW55_9CAUD|nr:hypothetical protein HOU32_gp069 [Dickeya phage vB_DsoM_JA11]AXG66473.1 hypothetical protein JA13_070 [Dickeya phage vB_DsoM_JA13]AXG67443.1 hypothetical protein JA33_069 [Dickeya phage vB_DsoM_JA33]AYD79874.1 hypothetical protein JA11_069 [Dickeya phage vB_DsoM_JA11]
MQKLKKYWLAFVGFLAIVVGIFLVRPNRSKTSNGISELQKAEDKIREKAIEQQKQDAEEVATDVKKLNEERKPDAQADQNKDMDDLAEEYKKL